MVSTYLIIGGDGLIGGALYRTLSKHGVAVYRTSRQPRRDGKSFFFDLGNSDINVSPHRPLWSIVRKEKPTVFIAAGVTGLKECETAPESTGIINVTNTTTVVGELVRAGCFVVFLSSNAVFSGQRPFPSEHERTCPSTEYGRQKVEVEEFLRSFPGGAKDGGQIAIVRLTKVLPDTRRLMQGWVASLRNGARIQAMDDYIFSPISLRFVTESLIKLASQQHGGIYHLSGDQDLSYYAFAQMLARSSGASADLVESVKKYEGSAYELGGGSLYSALGMGQTLRKAGISPQNPEMVVKEVLAA